MKYDVEKQHRKKKYHGIERLTLLFDAGSFTVDDRDYDGVICSFGTINGKKAFAYAQDFTYMGGTIGIHHGERIADTVYKAMEEKCPVIGIFDSAGARIDQGINALAGCGKMLAATIKASGFIPQISMVMGPCAGAAAYAPILFDFVFAVNSISNMYVTGPAVVNSVTGENCDVESLGGASMHASVSGQIHKVCASEKEAIAKVRELLDLICNLKVEYDPDNQGEREFYNLPSEANKTYDMREFIRNFLDSGYLYELKEKFAKSMFTGFGRIEGKTVGIIANQPKFDAGVINYDASDKAAAFVRCCDAFDIPIITWVDTPGYLPGLEEERRGIIRHGAKLLYSYVEAGSPKLTVIVRKAFGGAYIAMGSKALGVDAVCALPGTQIGVMGVDSAIVIIGRKELDKIENEAQRDEYIREFKEEYSKKLTAAEGIENGYIEETVTALKLRQWLADRMTTLQATDRKVATNKKHGNIPL